MGESQEQEEIVLHGRPSTMLGAQRLAKQAILCGDARSVNHGPCFMEHDLRLLRHTKMDSHKIIDRLGVLFLN